MLSSIFKRIFSPPDRKGRDRGSTCSVRGRPLRLESLESREMLSISPLEYDAIRSQLPDWNLSANITDYNVIEITASELSAASLQSAINAAAQTKQDDLIVVRMNSLDPNGQDVTDLRADIAQNGPLSIDIDSWNYGGVWIVALDTSENVESISNLLDNSEMIVHGGTFFNNNQYYSLPGYTVAENVSGYSSELSNAQILVGLEDYLNDPRFSNLKGTTYDTSGNIETRYTTVIIDTGIYYDHNDFLDDFGVSRIVASWEFTKGTPYDTYTTNTDTVGHGTHVASIAAGWNYGIAQDAGIIMLKVFPDNSDSTSSMYIASALDWVVTHASTYNIASVNMSLGGGNFQNRGDYTDIFGSPEYDSYLHTLAGMDIIVAVATGNSFVGDSFLDPFQPGIAAPSTNPSVISVSAVDNDDTIAYFAQRGPGLVDALAPGVAITAAGIFGGASATAIMSGTSMAAPVVAGAAVLAQQVADTYLGRRLTVEEFRKLLDATGEVIVDDYYPFPSYLPTYATYKRIDVYALADAIYCMAADIIVENTGDSGVGSLRQAILDCPVGGTIMFAPSIAGKTITLNDELFIDKSLTINTFGLDITIDANDASRVFNISWGTTVSLIGLTMTGGYTTEDGGGIYNDGATVTITDCTITGNISEYYGGGIYNNGTMTVTNSTISGNAAAYSEGGGIYNNGVLTVTRTEILGNSAGYTSGGICNNGTLTITSSVIVGNSSDAVGGILSYGAMTLTNSVVAGNAASLFGGIVNYFDTLTITNCTIAGNTAEYDEYGSGIATIGPVELYNTIIAKNAGADIDLISIYFFAGTAIGSHNLIGNGISSTILDVQSGSNVLVNNMVTNMVLAAMTKMTSFIQLNGYGGGYNGGSITSSQTGGTLEDGIDGNIVGTMTSPIDPLFMMIPNTIDASTTGLNYDPLDWNLRLQSGSVAINAGDNQLAFDAGLDVISRDIVGNRRFVGIIDMGAYEHNQTIMVTSTADSGPGSLRQAIADVAVGGTIFFDPLLLQDETITLAGSELVIRKSLAIDASGLDITIDADGNSRVFMIVRSTIEVSLIGLTITGGNQGFGGGVCNYGAVITITDCIISGNTAENFGGGIFNLLSTLTVINSVILGNSTAEGGIGGGICNAGTLTVTNSTIAGNTANDGGGIYNNFFGTLTLYNTIVAQNTGSDISNNGMVTGSHNLIGNGTNSTFQDGINGNIVGTAMLPIDPLFVKIPAMIDASNTGVNYNPLDWDLRLQAGSLAIDAGDDLLALNPDGSLIEFDRDGNLRFVGTVDIGAYEFQPLLV